MAGTVVSTTPRPTYGGRTLSSRERQLEARFRTTYIPNFQATSPSYAAVGSPHVISSQAKTASALGRQGASMLTGAAIGAILPGSLSIALTGIAAEAAVLGTSTAMTGLAGAAGSLLGTIGAIAPYAAVALLVAALIMGMKKGNRNISIQSIGLPENAPAILQQQGIGKGPTTLRHYRDFTGHWKDTARPIDAAGALTQQRIGALSRIFPGMRNVGKELAEAKEVMYGPSSSQQAAFGNIQHYVNALYKAEGFMTELFQDPIAQGYIGRKTNMTFEEFEKGFDFASQKVIITNVSLPDTQKSLADAWGKATRGSVYRSGGKIGGSGWRGPVPYKAKTQEYLGNVYRPVTTGGGKGRKKITTGYQIQTRPGSRKGKKMGQPAQWSDKLISVADYSKTLKEAQAKAREYFVGPQEKQIQEYQDYLVSTPQFGSYTQFRPFEPNWTPGTPQLGLPEDAPGPDIDTLKERLTITDGYYGGMGGGGFPQTRFGVTVPRMSQRGMARQA